MTTILRTARTSFPKMANKMIQKKSFSTDVEIQYLRNEVRSLKEQNWELRKELSNHRMEVHKQVTDLSFENMNKTSDIRLEIIKQNSETTREAFDRIYETRTEAFDKIYKIEDNLFFYGAAFATSFVLGGMYLNFKIEKNAWNIRYQGN